MRNEVRFYKALRSLGVAAVLVLVSVLLPPVVLGESAGYSSYTEAFDALKSDSGNPALFSPSERSELILMQLGIIRIVTQFEPDQAKKSNMEKGLAGLMEKHGVTGKLNAEDVPEGKTQIGQFVKERFAGVDTAVFLKDIQDFLAKYSNPGESEGAELESMKVVEATDEKANVLLTYADGSQEPAEFFQENGSWYLSMQDILYPENQGGWSIESE